MNTALVPRAAGLPGEVGNTLALRHVQGGRTLLSGQGVWCLIWRFTIHHQRVGGLGVRCRRLGYSIGVRQCSESSGFGVWSPRCGLQFEDFILQS